MQMVYDWLAPSLHIFHLYFLQLLPSLRSTDQMPAANTGSRTTLELATSWIAACSSHHSRCNRWIETPPYHPSRLLDLHGLETQMPIRLVETVDRVPEGPYATLSHRWGDQSFPRLVDGTREAFKDEIRLKMLPPTWFDAISVTGP